LNSKAAYIQHALHDIVDPTIQYPINSLRKSKGTSKEVIDLLFGDNLILNPGSVVGVNIEDVAKLFSDGDDIIKKDIDPDNGDNKIKEIKKDVVVNSGGSKINDKLNHDAHSISWSFIDDNLKKLFDPKTRLYVLTQNFFDALRGVAMTEKLAHNIMKVVADVADNELIGVDYIYADEKDLIINYISSGKTTVRKPHRMYLVKNYEVIFFFKSNWMGASSL